VIEFLRSTVMRYADAGYEEALDEARTKGVCHFRLHT
jgi:urocanate hydratase